MIFNYPGPYISHVQKVFAVSFINLALSLNFLFFTFFNVKPNSNFIYKYYGKLMNYKSICNVKYFIDGDLFYLASGWKNKLVILISCLV